MAFVVKAQDHYQMYIANSIDVGSFLSEQLLRKRHSEAEESALQMFNSKRNMDNEESDDPYLEILERKIKEQFSKNMLINKNANKTAIQAAQHTYNNYMASTWSPQVYCLHPEDLEKVHNDAKKAAINEFMSKRTSEEDEEKDSYTKTLIENLNSQYVQLKGINEANNKRAVEEAHNHYRRKMETNCKPSLLSVLIVPLVVKLIKQFPDFHEAAKSEAINVFQSRRRQLNSYSYDEYLNMLIDRLDQGYDEYCNPLRALAREFGVNV